MFYKFVRNIDCSFNTLVYIFFIIYHSNADNFCSFNNCGDSTRHALCKFETNNPALHCIDYEKTIKTKKDKQDILNKINSRRDKVASGDIHSLPSAENMLKMVWSDELEVSAQRWANQCAPYQELDSKDICTDSDKGEIGQNIATVVGVSPGLTPAILVDVWYMELLNINASLVMRYRRSNQTHLHHYDYFTQLAWAESNKVGCGGVKFTELITSGQNRTIHRLVCNFSPGGNQIGKPVFYEGVPCSRCPLGESCDLEYPFLCNAESTDRTEEKIHKYGEIFNNNYHNTFNSNVLNFKENKTIEDKYLSTDKYILDTVPEYLEPGDENVTGFDYFAQMIHSTGSTKKATSDSKTCKDLMPVEDFIEIFKKRLIKDQVLKQFLLTSKMLENKENSESGYNDATVADIMSHIYSQKEVSTTPKPTEPDYFNSTLLVDLVEAVIFRNNDKTSTVDTVEQNTNIVSDVSAIKIKAELGEVLTNLHSTGHYFFPEDDENEQVVKENTESYYDIASVPVSDIVLEIQELKRNKETKDFLDEILESDPDTENVTKPYLLSSTIFKSNKNGSDKIFLENYKIALRKKPLMRSKRSHLKKKAAVNSGVNNRIQEGMSFKIRNSDITVHLIDYRDLLRKIASDLDILKLNERFHCTGATSTSSSNLFTKYSLFPIFLIILNFI